MLNLRDITRVFGQTCALDAVSLHVAPAQTTVLLGPSGCGKSTLLRIMLGLIEPTAGTVEFEGERLTSANASRLRQKMGYVIQSGGLFPHLTARENITLLARYLHVDAGRITSRLDALAALVQLDRDVLDRYPVQLSGGQQQRIGLMRALMLDPDVLFLDEPLGALDPMVRSDLQAELRGIFAKLEKTVVMVTHDLREAAYLGHKIVLMRAGRVVQQGRFTELRDTPADPFVTEFIEAQRDPVELSAGGGL